MRKIGELEREAYLAAVISGDGYLHKNFIQIDGEKRWLEAINKIFLSTFKKAGKIKRKKGSKCWRLYICSKSISAHFNKKWKIPFGKKSLMIDPPIFKLTKKSTRKFYLIGWFDSECYVEKWKKPNSSKVYLRVQFKTKSRKIRDFLSKVLWEFGIQHSSYMDNEKNYRIQISAKRSMRKFARCFKLLNPCKKLPGPTGSKAEMRGEPELVKCFPCTPNLRERKYSPITHLSLLH